MQLRHALAAGGEVVASYHDNEGESIAAEALHGHLTLRQLRRHVVGALHPRRGRERRAPAAVLDEHGGCYRNVVLSRAQEPLYRRAAAILQPFAGVCGQGPIGVPIAASAA